MSGRESRISKVRKLLAIARGHSNAGHSNTHEMNNAAAMAARLMAEHGISDEDLEVDDDPVGDNREIAVEIGKGRKAASWKWNLAWIVAESANCKPYQIHSKVGTQIVALKVAFIGRRSDAQLCSHVYQYLLKQMQRLHAASLPQIGSRVQQYVPSPNWTPVLVDRKTQRQWSRDFYLAAVSVLHERMVSARDEVIAYAKQTSLVKLNIVAVEVDEFAESLGLSYVQSATVEIRSPTGYKIGTQAGRQINLDDAKNSHTRALPPSRSKK